MRLSVIRELSAVCNNYDGERMKKEKRFSSLSFLFHSPIDSEAKVFRVRFYYIAICINCEWLNYSLKRNFILFHI